MKIAINQPYFFPYLGYFSLIKHTNQFILLDVVQFCHQSWMRRNRILKQGNGWRYFSVPVIKGYPETLIKNVLIDNRQNWKRENLAQLQPYKKIAPNYSAVYKLLNDLFENEFIDIVALNKASLEIVCDYLEIENNIKIFSEMNLGINKPDAPDEWALNICKAIGKVDEYWNLPGGKNFYDKTKYDNAGLKIEFLRNNLMPYSQKRELFEPGLSIIDVMMFNSIREIHELIDSFELL